MIFLITEFFRKIVVVGDNIKVRRDENGIITIGIKNFLLDKNSLKLYQEIDEKIELNTKINENLKTTIS